MSTTPRGDTRSAARRQSNPIALILGSEAAEGGPWALLGLEPGVVSDRDVASALDRRLLQVNRHPLGGIPEADDVRLALHTAAAQVLHPEVRANLLDLRPQTTPGGAPSDDQRELDPILRVIAMHGGVNEQSIRRMMLLTGSGATSPTSLASEIQQKLVAWSHRKQRSPQPGAAARLPVPQNHGAALPVAEPAFVDDVRTRPPRDHELDPGVRALKVIVVAALAVICAAAVILIGVMLLLNRPQPGGPWVRDADSANASNASGASRTPGGLFPSSAEPKQAPDPAQSTEKQAQDAALAVDDPVALGRRLAAAAGDVATNATEAREAFASAAKALSTRWHRLAPDQLGAAQDSIIEFLYRCPDASITESALDSLLEPSKEPIWSQDRVRSEVWRAGLLTRLGRERDLSAAIRSMIERFGPQGARSDEPGTFARGALARLASLPGEMVGPVPMSGKQAPPSPSQAKLILAGWSAWREAARLVTGSDDNALDRLLLTGLETILADGPEPPQDYGLGEVVHDLVLQMSWRKDAAARRWLIASFSSTELSGADLAEVTRTLASNSGAEGVDSKMVLAINADDKDRMELRDAYASAWGMSDPARRDEMLVAWRDQVAMAEQPLRIDSRADQHHVAALGAAVTKARLNLAATMIWAGLIDEPALILKDPSSLATALVSQANSATTPQRIDEGGTDGSWAVQYLVAEQRVPERLKLLSELAKSNRPLGQVDAEVVVSEAVRGTPESVRSAARDVLDHWAETPPVLYALLEESYRIPKTRSNSQLVASITLGRIPSLRDPEWYAAVRRSLVEKLLQAIAARGPEKAIDLLRDELMSTCASRAKPSEAAMGSDSAAPTLPSVRKRSTTEDPIVDLLAQWRRTAEPMLATGKEPHTLDEIDRRMASRLSLSSGPVQEFAARHLAVAETMAYVVFIEQPGHSVEVKKVMEALATDRRKSEHVLDQIDAAEAAMLRLWRIRMEGGVS